MREGGGLRERLKNIRLQVAHKNTYLPLFFHKSIRLYTKQTIEAFNVIWFRFHIISTSLFVYLFYPKIQVLF